MIIKKLPEDKNLLNAIRVYRNEVNEQGVDTKQEGELLATIQEDKTVSLFKHRHLFYEDRKQVVAIRNNFKFFYSALNQN